MGVDTVKLSYPLGDGSRLSDLVRSFIDADGRRCMRFGEFTSRNYEDGAKGPVRYRTWHHPALRGAVTSKGVSGSSVVLMYEKSLPKELGVLGPCAGDCVDIFDTYLRGLFRDSGLRKLPWGTVRRCDLTEDVHDPYGLWRRAALGWNPHKRSRYVQTRFNADENVWQHNKSRGVRVYDKYAESGEEWSKDLTRVEYEIHGDWCEKYGLDVGCDWERQEELVLRPLVSDLGSRVAAICGMEGASCINS